MHIKLKIKVEIKNILENSFDSSTRDKICVTFLKLGVYYVDLFVKIPCNCHVLLQFD